jgi:hypothetical protein
MFTWWRMKKLETRRANALSSITGDRIHVELMAQRWRAADDPIDQELLATVLEQFAQIEQKARTVVSIIELEDFVSDAESQAIASAYFCPANEIQDEGNRAIDNLELWGIPKLSITKLRKTFAERLAKAESVPRAARAALHAIFIEVDEWSDYIEEYEETMRRYTLWMFGVAIALLFIAGVCFYSAHRFPLLMWFGLIAAGAAGSSASVLGKMPSFDLSLSGELDAYGRRIWSRIAVGTIGSLIGTAFLGWGLLPVTIKDQTFADALGACGTPGAMPCPMTKILIVMGVAMLLGSSERTLTSFEQRVFGSRSVH